MSANNDSISKTLIVTVSLCAICAVFVSAAAVGLKPLQLSNKALDKKTNILLPPISMLRQRYQQAV